MIKPRGGPRKKLKKVLWGIFISIICRHKIENRAFGIKIPKNDIGFAQKGLPYPRGPPEAYQLSPNHQMPTDRIEGPKILLKAENHEAFSKGRKLIRPKNGRPFGILSF